VLIGSGSGGYGSRKRLLLGMMFHVVNANLVYLSAFPLPSSLFRTLLRLNLLLRSLIPLSCLVISRAIFCIPLKLLHNLP
jgi:hypothetical protein